MVAPVVMGLVLDGARAVLDRVLPDPTKRAEAEFRLRELERSGELAQIDVNKAEAASPSLFVAGWRPAIGWTCAAALAGQFVVAPLVQWGAVVAGHPLPELPRLDGVLWELLFGMLGLGALRTVEKLKGKA